LKERVKVSVEKELLERLNAGRCHNAAAADPAPE